MSLQEQFLEAAEKVKSLPQKPTDNELLDVYGLYKQATMGDNCAEMPSVMDIVARKKWEAWKSKSGISKEEAQKSYINYVQSLTKGKKKIVVKVTGVEVAQEKNKQ